METPFETRYFTVTVDENGEVTDCDLDRIAAVDEETAEEYTQTAQQKNKTTGFQGIYRYRVTETEDGAKYVFLLVVIFSRNGLTIARPGIPTGLWVITISSAFASI